MKTLRFSLGAIEVALYERPGDYLDDDELDKLVTELREVARAGQPAEKEMPEYGVLLGDREDMRRRVVAMAYEKKTGRAVGFNALAWLDIHLGLEAISVLHLGLVYVVPEYQRKHLPDLLYGAATFLLFFRRGMRDCWISNVSQVPAICGMTAAKFTDVYPSHRPEARQSFLHLMLARAIMRDHRSAFGVGDDAVFDESRQVIQNAYTGGSDNLKKTFDEAPKHRDERANALCRDWLDYERGDDLLQLGRFTLGAALGFLRTKMPRGAATGLLLGGLALLLYGIVVPVTQWLFPEEQAA